jgi:hypothetical protein
MLFRYAPHQVTIALRGKPACRLSAKCHMLL